jgi:hypothetical protein
MSQKSALPQVTRIASRVLMPDTRLFSFWMVFISVTIEVSMPPNFERQP